MLKFSMEWQVVGEVSFIDIGNGFSLIKFSIEVDCNSVFYGQSCLLVVQFIDNIGGKRTLILSKRSSSILYFGFGFPVSTLSLRVDLWWRKY